MSERVVGGVDAEGRAVVRKRVSGTWEVDALIAARHPGVVELLGARSGDLELAYAGTRSLASAPPLSLDRIVAVGARMAATLSDLHSQDVVHGRIDPTHVLLGPDGQPVLCGFSGATVRGRTGPATTPTAPGFGDPRLRPDEPVPPAADVYGIGAVLRFLLDRGGGRLRPPAGRRRLLDSIIRRATSPEPHRRPTAAQLADRLGRMHRSRVGLLAAVTAAAAATGIAATVAALTVLTLVHTESPAESSAGRAHRLGPVRAKAVDLPVVPARPAPVVVEPNLVAHGSDRYEAGSPGDQVVLGDWDCDGEATVGLLRPSSGEVFLFDGWASAGRQLRETAITVVPGSVRATVVDREDDGCDGVLVERITGEPVEVWP